MLCSPSPHAGLPRDTDIGPMPTHQTARSGRLARTGTEHAGPVPHRRRPDKHTTRPWRPGPVPAGSAQQCSALGAGRPVDARPTPGPLRHLHLLPLLQRWPVGGCVPGQVRRLRRSPMTIILPLPEAARGATPRPKPSRAGETASKPPNHIGSASTGQHARNARPKQAQRHRHRQRHWLERPCPMLEGKHGVFYKRPGKRAHTHPVSAPQQASFFHPPLSPFLNSPGPGDQEPSPSFSFPFKFGQAPSPIYFTALRCLVLRGS